MLYPFVTHLFFSLFLSKVPELMRIFKKFHISLIVVGHCHILHRAVQKVKQPFYYDCLRSKPVKCTCSINWNIHVQLKEACGFLCLILSRLKLIIKQLFLVWIWFDLKLCLNFFIKQSLIISFEVISERNNNAKE